MTLPESRKCIHNMRLTEECSKCDEIYEFLKEKYG